MKIRSVSASRLLLATAVVSLAVLSMGVSSAFAAGPSVDQSVNAGNSSAFTIGTSRPNELILVAADGWYCASGQQVTVDGSPATLVASAGDCFGDTGDATVFQFVAPTAGTHNVAVNEGNYCCGLYGNFAVSLLNASSTGITSTTFNGTATTPITTSQPNEYVFATSAVNNGEGNGTVSWSGSPVTPTLLQSAGICGDFCGLDFSIAGFTAPTPGSYSASMSDTVVVDPSLQTTILVAVPAGVDALFDALHTAVTGVGPGHSLADKVALAKSYFDSGDTADACGTLTGFINEVKAQTGKKITPAQAANFIAQAQAIEAQIGC